MNDTRLEASSKANFYQSHRGPLKDIAVIGGVESGRNQKFHRLFKGGERNVAWSADVCGD